MTNPLLRLFLDPIKDNGDINGMAVMFICGMLAFIGFIIFEKLTEGKW